MNEKTVFKQIIDRELPAHIIYEDNDFMVFLDAFPKSLGHTLVIPKQEARWAWDVIKYDEYFELARRIARAQQKAFGTDMIYLSVQGDEVPHAHIHLRPKNIPAGDMHDFETIAEKIKKAL